jgi:hypothetical protein
MFDEEDLTGPVQGRLWTTQHPAIFLIFLALRNADRKPAGSSRAQRRMVVQAWKRCQPTTTSVLPRGIHANHFSAIRLNTA